MLFPAEVLPIVSVLANMVHFCAGPADPRRLHDLATSTSRTGTELSWFPVIVLVQLVFTLGLALLLAALTVHFRDIRDLLANLLTFWFFATPIIYCYRMDTVQRLRTGCSS